MANLKDVTVGVSRATCYPIVMIVMCLDCNAQVGSLGKIQNKNDADSIVQV